MLKGYIMSQHHSRDVASQCICSTIWSQHWRKWGGGGGGIFISLSFLFLVNSNFSKILKNKNSINILLTFFVHYLVTDIVQLHIQKNKKKKPEERCAVTRK